MAPQRFAHYSSAGLILLLAFIACVDGQNLEKSRSVWVEQGLVRGKIYKIAEKQVQIFRGIPYAEPPVGPLRFRVIRKGSSDSADVREYFRSQ